MGIGDTIIFLPYIQAISKKFNSPVSLLVKKSSKANQYLKLNGLKPIDWALDSAEDNNEQMMLTF